MHNCYKVFVNDRLYAIVHTFADACALANLISGKFDGMVTTGVKPAYIPDIGF